MKSVFSKAVVVFSMMASLVMAGGKDATADDEAGMSPESKAFVQGLVDQTVTIIKAGGIPKDVASFEVMLKSTEAYVAKATQLIIEATGKKEAAASFYATLTELNGKEKLSKDEQKQIEAANDGISKVLADANTVSDDKKEFVARALGYTSQAILNYTLLSAGGKDVVAGLKAQGPSALGQVKEISGTIGSLPKNLSASKTLTAKVIGIMQVHSLAIPSPDKATAGIEKM